MLSWLYSHCRSKKQVNEAIQTAFDAAKNHDRESLKDVLQNLNPNVRDEKHFTLVHRIVISTCMQDQQEAIATIQVALDAKADINLPFKEKGRHFTPLHSAIRRGLYALADFLVENKADNSIRDDKGKTATDYIRDEDERAEIKKFLKL